MSEKQRNNQKKSPENLAFEAWRILKIQSEFSEAIDKLADIAPAVSIFGSARIEKPTNFSKSLKKSLKNYHKQEFRLFLVADLELWKPLIWELKRAKKGFRLV